jgi:hypothetical protein
MSGGLRAIAESIDGDTFIYGVTFNMSVHARGILKKIPRLHAAHFTFLV